MAYNENEKSTGLDVLTTLASGDLIIVGDVSDSGRAKAITRDNLIADVDADGDSVQSVTGLNTDNTDPKNPIVQVSVDGTTVVGAGTIASPLRSLGGGGSTKIDQTPDNGTYDLLVGAVDGVNDVFTVSNGLYTSGTLVVYKNGEILQQGAGASDWTETTPGAGTFTFNTPPSIGDKITAIYASTSFSRNVRTLIPLPTVPVDNSGSPANTVTGNTVGIIGQVYIPSPIIANKFSIMSAGTINVAGTLKITLYSEDGQSQILSFTTANISAVSTIYTTALASISIQPGIYYLMVQPVGTANVQMMFHGIAQSPFSETGAGPDLPSGVTSEPVLYGTYTVVADTVPATITPTSVIRGGQKPVIAFRLDN